MRKRYIIKDAYKLGLLKLGRKILTNGNSICTDYSQETTGHEGIIGEHSGSEWYFHQNYRSGRHGIIRPGQNGYNYSWAIPSNDNGWIEFLDEKLSGYKDSKFLLINGANGELIDFAKDKDELGERFLNAKLDNIEIYKIERVPLKLKIQENA